jgi:arginine decarboxylase
MKGRDLFPNPTRMFLTKGVGVHRHALTAFEFALREADIEQQNLVYVSSILPPRCQVISREAAARSAQSRTCAPAAR